jgi:hypothetical protein
VLVPLHVSVVQALPSSVQADPFGLGEQVPTSPLRLQAEHSFVQALSQQTPLLEPDGMTQKLLAHWAFAVHVSANEAS